jgi:hypothetical protein
VRDERRGSQLLRDCGCDSKRGSSVVRAIEGTEEVTALRCTLWDCRPRTGKHDDGAAGPHRDLPRDSAKRGTRTSGAHYEQLRSRVGGYGHENRRRIPELHRAGDGAALSLGFR